MSSRPDGGFQNFVGIEIALKGNRRSDPDGFVGHPHVRGLAPRKGERRVVQTRRKGERQERGGRAR